MKRYRRTAASQYIIVILILAGIIGFGISGTILMRRIPFEDHFVIPWAAGRSWLLEGVSPYDPSVEILGNNSIEQSDYLASLPEMAAFIDPVLNLIFYLPFSLIPYEISRGIWVTLIMLSMGLIGYLSLKIADWKISDITFVSVLAMSVFWFPGIFAAMTGQLSPIVILIILLGIHLIMIDQDTTAGFLLSLTFASLPTTALILLFIVVWSIVKRRWSVISAYFAGVAFLMAVSLLILPNWLLDWLRVLLKSYENLDWVQTPLMRLAGMLPGVADFLSIFLHAALVIYLVIVWITLKGNSQRVFIWKALILLVGAFLLNIQGDVYHLFLILPAGFLIFRSWSERWGIFGRILSWLFMIVVAVGSWIISLPDIPFTLTESSPLLLILLPLLVLVGMVWIRWWAVKIPRLPFEAQ